MPLPPLRTGMAGRRLIAWREQGNGPAVVFFHGICGSSAVWEHQYGFFADQFRVVAWDMPGYGGSHPFTKVTPTDTDYAEILGLFLDALEIDRAHIMAHSVGAIIAATFARVFPNRLYSLILAHGLPGFGARLPDEREKRRNERLRDFDANGSEAFAKRHAHSSAGPYTTPEIFRNLVSISAAVPRHAYYQAAAVEANSDIFRSAPMVDAPTLVLSGALDRIAPESSQRAIAKAIRGAEHRVLLRCGHYSCIEQPEFHNSTLRDFLVRI